MASAGARAYNGGMGTEPQRGPKAEPLVRGEAPEADRLYRDRTSKIRGKSSSFQFFPVFKEIKLCGFEHSAYLQTCGR